MSSRPSRQNPSRPTARDKHNKQPRVSFPATASTGHALADFRGIGTKVNQFQTDRGSRCTIELDEIGVEWVNNMFDKVKGSIQNAAGWTADMVRKMRDFLTRLYKTKTECENATSDAEKNVIAAKNFGPITKKLTVKQLKAIQSGYDDGNTGNKTWTQQWGDVLTKMTILNGIDETRLQQRLFVAFGDAAEIAQGSFRRQIVLINAQIAILRKGGKTVAPVVLKILCPSYPRTGTANMDVESIIGDLQHDKKIYETVIAKLQRHGKDSEDRSSRYVEQRYEEIGLFWGEPKANNLVYDSTILQLFGASDRKDVFTMLQAGRVEVEREKQQTARLEIKEKEQTKRVQMAVDTYTPFEKKLLIGSVIAGAFLGKAIVTMITGVAGFGTAAGTALTTTWAAAAGSTPVLGYILSFMCLIFGNLIWGLGTLISGVVGFFAVQATPLVMAFGAIFLLITFMIGISMAKSLKHMKFKTLCFEIDTRQSLLPGNLQNTEGHNTEGPLQAIATEEVEKLAKTPVAPNGPTFGSVFKKEYGDTSNKIRNKGNWVNKAIFEAARTPEKTVFVVQKKKHGVLGGWDWRSLHVGVKGNIEYHACTTSTECNTDQTKGVWSEMRTVTRDTTKKTVMVAGTPVAGGARKFETFQFESPERADFFVKILRKRN